MVEGTGVCCIALVPAVIATLGIAASVLSSVWCEAIKFVPEVDLASDKDAFRFGLFYYSKVSNVTIDSAESIFKVIDSCADYPEGTPVDAAWKAARAFAIIAPIFAGFLAVGLYMSPCCIFYYRATWQSLAVLEGHIDAANSALLSDSQNTTEGGNFGTIANRFADNVDALQSAYEEGCSWDWGMYANLVSLGLFFVTGVVMIMMGAPTRPPPKPTEIQTVTYQQTTNDHGEVVVEEVDVTTDALSPNNSSPVWANPNQPVATPY
ncbi:expressed unknown protein [Seminavis robusta]|uniref:Uncharacterized protein n=1 Tax=Seminavis robusta TaxID=568900 RepID=A0A9N8DFP3_9STRA|nr:expressed unknown protein [Seminavis robusta]|eukprot:Sro66_g037320.1 n/a (265) ;mRNA; r:116719-117674